MKNGKTLVQLAQELERQAANMKDYIVPSQEMEMVAFEGHEPTLRINGHGEHGITETGHETLVSRLEIPARYYDRMRRDAPALLSYNVNTWARQEGAAGVSRMVRTLDGNARAVLSDRYRRLDNYEFLNAVLPAIQDAHIGQIEIQSTEITERRMYVQMTFAELETTFDVERGGRKVGEVVRAGLVLKNSEVGAGCREIKFLLYTLACTNGLVVPKEVAGLSNRHTGIRQGNGEIFAMSREAQEADATAFALATRDAVRQMVSREYLQEVVGTMQAAHQRKITGHPEQAVKVLGNTYRMTQEEQSGILRHLIEGGDLSHYGMVNAVTRTAQDVASYDRAVEMEEIGGVFLQMPARQLQPILAAKA